MKFCLTIAASIGLALIAGCAVTPASTPATVPACTTAAAPESTSPVPVAIPPAPAAAAAHPAFVRPVVPPLPPELYPPSIARATAPKPVIYGADQVAAMLETVASKDVFVAGGDTYFWHKDPHGRRERVFYGHGDRRTEIAQRHRSALNGVADSAAYKND